MNHNLKRALALVCTLAMLLTFVTPALAAENVIDVPVIGSAEQHTHAVAPVPAEAEESAAPVKLQSNPVITISTTELDVGTGTQDVDALSMKEMYQNVNI